MMSLNNSQLWKRLLSQTLTKHAIESLNQSIPNPPSLFDLFTSSIDDHFLNLRSTNMKDLKKARDVNRQKGTIFEQICKELLLKGIILGGCDLKEVWSYAEIPNELLLMLGFVKSNGKVNRRDMGIDLIARDGRDRWYAIQCKYLSKSSKIVLGANGYPRRWAVPWDDLSTFYALCGRTGPINVGWHRLVIMTNSTGIQRQGRPQIENETLISHGNFIHIDRASWGGLCGYMANTLGTPLLDPPIPKDEIKDVPKEEEVKEVVPPTDKKMPLKKRRNKTLTAKELEAKNVDMKEKRNTLLDRLVSNVKD